MKCPLCGHLFGEEEGRNACKGCFLGRACPMVACPNCGYEVPREPKWIKALTKRRTGDGTRGKG